MIGKLLDEKDSNRNDREESDNLCDYANGNDDHYDDKFEIKIENVDPRSPDEEHAFTDENDGIQLNYANDERDDKLKSVDQASGKNDDCLMEDLSLLLQ